MFGSYFRSLAFGPLAAALMLSAIATPHVRDVGQGFRLLTERHSALIAGLRPAFGADFSALGPHIEFAGEPSPKAGGPLGSGDPLRLYPVELEIDVDLTTQAVYRDGFRMKWMMGDVRLTARFAEPPEWPTDFAPGNRPDWSHAVLRMPYPAPQSLASFPEISVAGQTWRMDQNWGAHNKLTLEYPIRGQPTGDVVITYRRTAVGPDIVIGANGRHTQINLSSDFPVDRRSGPAPEKFRSTPFGSDWRWNIDRSATFDDLTGKAEAAAPTQPKGFLGIAIKEPDDTGDISLHTALTQPVFSDISGLVQFTPMAFAAAALMAFFCGVRGYGPQLGLALVGLLSLAVTYYVAKTFDDMIGWSAGGMAAAIGTAATLHRQERRTAMVVTLAFAAAWMALLLLPARLDPNLPLPLAIIGLRMAQPAAFLLGLFAAFIAMVGSAIGLVRRRRTSI